MIERILFNVKLKDYMKKNLSVVSLVQNQFSTLTFQN